MKIIDRWREDLENDPIANNKYNELIDLYQKNLNAVEQTIWDQTYNMVLATRGKCTNLYREFFSIPYNGWYGVYLSKDGLKAFKDPDYDNKFITKDTFIEIPIDYYLQVLSDSQDDTIRFTIKQLYSIGMDEDENRMMEEIYDLTQRFPNVVNISIGKELIVLEDSNYIQKKWIPVITVKDFDKEYKIKPWYNPKNYWGHLEYRVKDENGLIDCPKEEIMEHVDKIYEFFFGMKPEDSAAFND